MLVIICFDAEESLAPLIVGCHGDRFEELLDFSFINIESIKYPHGPLFHDILGAGTGGHPCYFSPDTFPDNRVPECPSCHRPGVDLDDFVTGSPADRGFTLDHELTAHEDFSAVCIFVPVKELARHNTAEFFNLIDIPVNGLLEDFIDYLEIPREVCTFQTARQVNIDIKIRDKNDRSFLMPVDFHQFFDILDSDTGEVYADVRR